MVGRAWTDYELAIVVYFASRKADYEACSKILALKSAGQFEARLTVSVRSKLDKIREMPNLWNTTNGWNLEAVDNWLISLNVPELRAAIAFSNEELSLISPVSAPPNLTKNPIVTISLISNAVTISSVLPSNLVFSQITQFEPLLFGSRSAQREKHIPNEINVKGLLSFQPALTPFWCSIV